MAGKRQRRGGNRAYDNNDLEEKRADAGRNIKRVLFCMVAAVLLFASVTAGAIVASGRLNNALKSSTDLTKEQEQNLFTDDTIKSSGEDIKGRLNVLLIGTDKAGFNTDVLMLVSYDIDSGKINMTSIPRDFWSYGNGSWHKVNSSMALGGDELMFQTVKDLTGVPINYYAKVGTDGFRAVVDIVGGVDFEVPMRLKYTDPYQDLYIDLEEGFQHLDGDKAEQLVRFRKADAGYPNYVRSDYDRTQVQRNFMKALIEQKFNAGLITKVPQLYTQLTQYIKTNISAADAVKYADLINKIMNMNFDEDIQSFEMKALSKKVNGLWMEIPDIDYNLKLCQEYFGGTGTSDQLAAYRNNYSKYGGATNDTSNITSSNTVNTGGAASSGSSAQAATSGSTAKPSTSTQTQTQTSTSEPFGNSTAEPSASAAPSESAGGTQTVEPITEPSAAPSTAPSAAPSAEPSVAPSTAPSAAPQPSAPTNASDDNFFPAG